MKFNNLIREYIEQIKSELDVTKIENYFIICYININNYRIYGVTGFNKIELEHAIYVMINKE